MSVLWNREDLAKLSRAYFRLLFEEDKEKYKHTETYHLFMAILYALYDTKEVDKELLTVLPENSIYRRFLDQWDTTDESLLKDLLFEICDFHIYSSLDLKDKFSELFSVRNQIN